MAAYMDANNVTLFSTDDIRSHCRCLSGEI